MGLNAIAQLQYGFVILLVNLQIVCELNFVVTPIVVSVFASIVFYVLTFVFVDSYEIPALLKSPYLSGLFNLTSATPAVTHSLWRFLASCFVLVPIALLPTFVNVGMARWDTATSGPAGTLPQGSAGGQPGERSQGMSKDGSDRSCAGMNSPLSESDLREATRSTGSRKG